MSHSTLETSGAHTDDSVCRACGSQFKPILGLTELATFFVEDVACPVCDEFDLGGEAG